MFLFVAYLVLFIEMETSGFDLLFLVVGSIRSLQFVCTLTVKIKLNLYWELCPQ